MVGSKGCEGDAGNIEIRFVVLLFPDTLAIPIGGGKVNVGIGIFVGLLDKQKKLKTLQADVIANHPLFKERFADAELIEGTSKGWQLPFGSPRKGEKNQPRSVHPGVTGRRFSKFSRPILEKVLEMPWLVEKWLLGTSWKTEVALNTRRSCGLLGPELTNSFKCRR